MTNKQERFLVMSEAEFEAAIEAAKDTIHCISIGDKDSLDGFKMAEQKAEAACRAREVPSWATHFCKLDYYKVGDQIEEAEEIKR